MQPVRRCVSRQNQARAFQRLCRGQTSNAASTNTILVHCTQHRTFSASEPRLARRTRNEPEGNTDGDEINFYEQEFVGGQHGAVRRVGGPRSLEKRIKELEREIEALKSGESLDWLPEKDREELRRGIREARQTGELDEDASLGREELEELLGDQPPPDQQVRDLLATEEEEEQKLLEEDEEAEAREGRASPEVALRLPDMQTKTVRKLNSALRAASAEDAAPNAARLLWQSYRASKQNVPGVLQGLPSSAWKILWASQYEPGALAEDVRSKHLWILLDDMIATDVPLTPTQKVVRVEGHMVAGRLGKAIRWWNQCREELSNDSDVGAAFLELGPRIHAQMGDMDAAEKLALEIGNNGSGQASFFVPVIESLLRQGDDASIARAAGLYVKMRCALGTRITLRDLDRSAMAFLQNGQVDVALGVFRDLVAFSCKGGRDKDDEGAAAYQTSMRLYADIAAQSPDARALNTTAHQALCFLPRRLENRFFYASWLKRLIGLGELDAAAKVLELMHQRKVRPDAMHLNGLISAWLRGARPADIDLALNLGHAMIQKRIVAVASRGAAPASREPQVAGTTPSPSINTTSTDTSSQPQHALPTYLAENIPPATIETFSILLLHYSRHDMRASISALQSALHSAGLDPNAFFLNHLLRTHQRSQEFSAAWGLFATSQRNRVRPDLETFACLWDMCRAHSMRQGPGAMQAFPLPRGLFGHTMGWMNGASEREQFAARQQFSGALYAVMARSFFIARDLRGCLVALHALREAFGVYPDEEAALCVTALVAAIGERPAARHEKVYVPGVGRARIRGAKGAYLRRKKGMVSVADDDPRAESQARVARLLEDVRAARRAELEARGVRDADLSPAARSEEALWILSSFLRAALRERAVHVAALRASALEDGPAMDREEIVGGEDEKIEQVAFEMGAGGIVMGAPLYEKKGGQWVIAGWEVEDDGEE